MIKLFTQINLIFSFIIGLVCNNISQTISTEPNNKKEGYEIFAKGLANLEEKRYEKALNYFNEAQTYANKNNLLILEAESVAYLYLANKYLGLNSTAEGLIDKIINNLEESNRLGLLDRSTNYELQACGILYAQGILNESNFNTAKEAYQKLLNKLIDTNQKSLVAFIYEELSEISFYLNDIISSEYYNSAAIALSEEAKEYYVLGDALYNRANYKECIDSLSIQCGSLIQKAKSAYANLGVDYFLISIYSLEYMFFKQNIGDVRAIEAIEKYKDITQKYNMISGLPNYFKFRADLYFDNKDYKNSIVCLSQELELRKSLNNEYYLARCYSDLAWNYSLINIPDSTAFYGYQSFLLYSKNNSFDEIVVTSSQVILALININEKKKAEEIVSYFEKNISNIKDFANYYTALNIIGSYYNFYSEKINLDKAEEYYRNAYNYAKGVKEEEITQLLNIANVYFYRQNFSQVKVYLDFAMRECNESNCNQSGIINLRFAESYYTRNDSLTKHYGENALEIFRQQNDIPNTIRVLTTLSRLNLKSSPNYGIQRSMELLTLAKRLQDSSLIMSTYSIIADNYRNQVDLEQSLIYREKELELAKKLKNDEASFYALYGILNIIAAKEPIQKQELSKYFGETEKLISKNTASLYFNGLALICWKNLDDPIKAKKYFLKAIETFHLDEIGNPYDFYGDFLMTQGDRDSALVCYSKAMGIYQDKNQYLLTANTAKKIADIYRDYTSEFKKALKFYDIAYQVFNSVTDSSNQFKETVGTIIFSSAVCYLSLGQMEGLRSQAYLALQSNSIWREMGYALLFMSYNSSNQDSFFYYLDKTLESDIPEEFKVYAALFKVEYAYVEQDSLEMQKLKNIINLANIEKSIFDENSEWKYAIIGIQRYFQNDTDYRKHFLMADSLANRNGRFNNKSIINKIFAMLCAMSGEYKESINLMYKALTDLDTHLITLSESEAITQTIDQRSNADLAFLIALTKNIYKQTRDQYYLIKLLEFSEIISARSTLIYMNNQNKKSSRSEFYITESNLMKEKISDINKKILTEHDFNKVEELLGERDGLLQKIKYLNDDLISENMKIGTDQTKPVLIDELKSLLNGNVIVVKYFLNQKQSFAIAFDKNNIWSFEIPEQKSIEVDVKIIKNYFSNFNNNARQESFILTQNSYSLYNSLIAPIFDKIKENNLVIVPDKILFYLPFELLLCDTSGVNNKAVSIDYDFLINHCSVSYAPSLSLFYQLNKKTSNTSENRIALIGKSDFSKSQISSSLNQTRSLANFQNLNDLPGVAKELDLIKKTFIDKNSNSEVETYLNLDAQEQNIKNIDLSRFKYLHFATHGLVDDDYPDFTSILLDEISNPTMAEDGFLNLFEIMELDINSDLVVLSACNTALGKLYSGEGMIGLNRAFFISGAKSICSTLWSIADESTSMFMANFYKYLLSGYSKTLALSRAKLDMVASKKYSSPYYWAPYVLSGAIN